MTPVQKMPKDDFKKQIDIVYSLLSMLNSDANASSNTFRLLGGNNPETVGKVKVNGKVLEAVMRLTFEEKYRKSICDLEGLQAISAILVDCTSKLDAKPTSDNIIKKLKHTCMALTNLTYGDIHNKKIVCSIEDFVPSLVKLLDKSGEDLRKVVAGVIRNISWKADSTSKMVLRESGVVFGLLKCSMETERESTLKCLLNALWNISSHSAENKADICDYPHSLEFIVSLLNQSETIVENGGGILKNISSHIAVNDHCRQILRKHHCLELLLSHLQSSNIVVVANACGTLWNLSARCAEDQQSLWKLGAVGLLGNLVNSEDKAISLGSSAALKNLLLFKTNSSSLFSSCSSSPSDDKNKESAYYIDRKKEKEASADSSTSHLFQPVTIKNSYNENTFKTNNIQNNVFQKSIHQANASKLFQNVPQSNYDVFEADIKPNLYYGFDESTDEIIDFSNKYKENCFGSSTDQLLNSTKPLYSPSEHPKHYCTEDTPETYSEINAPACNLSSIETPFNVTSTSQSDAKMYDKPNKAILVNYKSSGSSENSSNPNSGQKSVTFSEINQTPMMFSRTTSLDSVNSFEATSVHSSVGSIYSHRPSGVVSPSELPDSPGETMPPSPHTGKEEAKKIAVNNDIPSLNENHDDNANGDEVNDYDFSDNENENEELLEEVIEAAMPNGLKQKREMKKFATDDIKSYYAEDTIKCYMSEGTPLIFSRNDSLSSLGSKSSPQRSNNYALSALHPKVKNFIFNHEQLTNSHNKEANLTSTPSVKTIPILEDQVLKYEVEGTPDKVPPLSFDDEEDGYQPPTHFNNKSNKNREQNQSKQIQYTKKSNQSFNKSLSSQANTISTSSQQKFPQTAPQESETHDDSDSSVSFESSDVDTSPLDNRLLQECIVSGLPKNKKRKHRKFLFDYEQLHKNESSEQQKDGSRSNEVSRATYHEEEEYVFSGPSTEANNTVIYRGVLLSEGIDEMDEDKKVEVMNGKDGLTSDEVDEKDELMHEKVGLISENDELVNDKMSIKDELLSENDGKIPNDCVEKKDKGEGMVSHEELKKEHEENEKLETTQKHLLESDIHKGETNRVEESVSEESQKNLFISSAEKDTRGDTLPESQRDQVSHELAAVAAQLEITSTASEGNYDTSDPTDCDKQQEFLALVSDFYTKTSIKEKEENIFQFKPRSPITSSVSDGNIKASNKSHATIKSKKHSKSKVFDFIKKSLKKKKKNPS